MPDSGGLLYDQGIGDNADAIPEDRVYWDGDCNMARSWIWAAARYGFGAAALARRREFSAAEGFGGEGWGKVTITTDPLEAARGANVLAIRN